MPDDALLLETRDFIAAGAPASVLRVLHRSTEHENPVLLHRHEFMELAIVVGGRGKHITEGHDAALRIGDVLVIPPGRSHTYSEVDDLRLLQVLFLPEKIIAYSSLLENLRGFAELFGAETSPREPFRRHLHLTAPDLGLVSSYAQRIKEETRQRAMGYEVAAVGLLSALTIFLSRRFWHTQPHVTSAYARIEGTMTYLQKHYAEPIDLKELAKQAHLSVTHLMRLFHQATDSSPMQYLIRLRVLKAADLLRESNLTVTEAAYASGFLDRSYFSKRFSQVMGISPRRYQRQWRKV